MPTDLSGLRRQVAAALKAATPAAIIGTAQIAHAAMGQMVIIAPRDTNRYVRAWAEANNQLAGTVPEVPRLAMQALRESKYVARNEGRLDRQVAKIEKRIERAEEIVKYWSDILHKRYDAIGRKGRWRTQTAARLKKAEDRLDQMLGLLTRAREERDIYAASLKDGGVAMLIGGRRGKPGKDGKFKFGANQLTTVRARVYGGEAHVLASGSGKVFVVATNKEAHASIIESKKRVVARANAIAGTSGRHRAGRAIAAKIRASVPQSI